MIQAIILDWGRTLWDQENNCLFPETLEVLNYLSKKYRLILVSVCSREPVSVRFEKIKNLNLDSLFEAVLIDPERKEHLLDLAFEKLKLNPEEIAVIGDRMIREIAWGNQKGCKTIWIQKGKFANNLPNSETSQPMHTIHNLNEVLNLL